MHILASSDAWCSDKPTVYTMTKPELIAAIHTNGGPSKGDIASTLSLLPGVFADALAAGGKIALPGIGTFSVKQTSERQARNPRTGEVVTIPAGKKVAFKVHPALKAAVNS